MLAHLLLCENSVFSLNREQVDRPIIINNHKGVQHLCLTHARTVMSPEPTLQQA